MAFELVLAAWLGRAAGDDEDEQARRALADHWKLARYCAIREAP